VNIFSIKFFSFFLFSKITSRKKKISKGFLREKKRPGTGLKFFLIPDICSMRKISYFVFKLQEPEKKEDNLEYPILNNFFVGRF